ncbi:sigma-70 family RNA polymerase sigma factor [Pacificispira spongiicola]|nr:sigma-70 family RNA polymerase sigma factor [Pacificispira spongiicola]
MTSPDTRADMFETHRPRLVRLAYRMVGTMPEAEDIVQDAWIRWERTESRDIRDAGAYLRRTVARLCLDHLKSARTRRETYFGSWLPEPILDEGMNDDLREDHLTLTLMLALERLSPLERAAFLLHDVFDTPMPDIAEALGRDAAAIRQLASRARKHVRDSRPRFPLEKTEGERIAKAFFDAAKSGDADALRGLLSDAVIARSDGGGRVAAFPNPVYGADRVTRLFEGIHRKFGGAETELIRLTTIDGLPGFISRDPEGVLQTVAFEIIDGRIVSIFITRNPDKMTVVARALN